MIELLVQYYTDLLIIQYNQQPNARATVESVVREMLMNAIFFDVRDGFNIDTAVGLQLDVIGKYVGIDRSYQGQNFEDPYFAFVEYGEPTPYDALKLGFINQTDWGDDDGSTLTYADIVSETNLLNDEDYRFIIKLKIITNNINMSHQQIDDALFTSFGEEVVADSLGDMEMIFFVPSSRSTIVQVALQKKVLPKPAAVGVPYLIEKDDDLFSFASYSNMDAFDGFTGFTTYADFDTKDGGTLTYRNLIEV